MPKDEEVVAAIRKLRDATGLSQTEFAHKYFQRTLSSQQRYEKHLPPDDILVALVYIAREIGRADLADVFKAAVLRKIPEAIKSLILERPNSNPR